MTERKAKTAEDGSSQRKPQAPESKRWRTIGQGSIQRYSGSGDGSIKLEIRKKNV